MLSHLLTAYLWVAMFTALSVTLEWPFTGSKENYRAIRWKLTVSFEDSPRWCAVAYLVFLLGATFLWPYVYWYRAKDVLRSRL